MSKQLPERDINLLRQCGLLRESEIAFKEGTTVVAEDLLTKERRILDVSGLMLEAERKILHD